MGTDKALLPWRHITMVEQAAQILRSVADSVTLVGEPERYRNLGFPCIADLRPGLGPLAGLEAALSTTQTLWSVVLPCDMPGVDASVLAMLCDSAGGSSSKAVLLRDVKGIVHPLCGLYRRDCLTEIQRALDAGQLRLMDVVKGIGPAYVDIACSVTNINTPEQWSAAVHCSESFHGN
jgi:molybdopterin-guanine dinucleotide biosynthesis protein A